MSITNAMIYVSPSSQDPSGQGGFNGAGNIWAQNDTGLWYVRNSSNTGWTLIGSGDQASFGMYSLAGGAGSGAITGATGLVTTDGNTPFAIPPTVTNRNSLIATLADLSALQTNLQALINTTVAQSIAAIPTPGVNSSIVIKVGTVGPALTPTGVLSLPFSGMVYPDGSAVQLSDCHGFAAAGGGSLVVSATLNLLPQDAQGMSWECYSAGNGFSIVFIIIAIKPTS